MNLKALIPKNKDIRAILFYVILTAIMTFPVILNLDKIMGSIGDAYELLWGFWWIKKSLLEMFQSYNFSEFLFYPSGVNLSFFTFTLFNTLFFLPLTVLSNPVFSYNIALLFTYVASGFGMYKLSKYIIKDEKISLICGTIFAFAPFHFAQSLGHIHISSIQWVPFYILYLMKAFETKNNKDLIISGVFLFLVALASWHIMIYCILFALFFWVYKLIETRKLNIKEYFIHFTTFGILISPFALPLVIESAKGYMTRSLDASVMASADLLGFITPSELHPIFGNYVTGITSFFSGNVLTYTVFIGFSVLILSLIGIKKTWKKHKFLLACLILFIILSLGPLLHIKGRFLFNMPLNLGNTLENIGIFLSPLGKEIANNYIAVPLPYLLLYLFFPFFAITRTPSNFITIVMIFVSIFAGLGIKEVLNRYVKTNLHNLVLGLILIIILFEYLAVPYPMLDTDVNPFFHELGEQKEDFAIVNVPIISQHEYMYYQTIHEKKIIGGVYGRRSPETYEFVNTVPLLNHLKLNMSWESDLHTDLISRVMKANPSAENILSNYLGQDIYSTESNNSINYTKADINILKENKIKYIIIHPEFIDSEEKTQQALSAVNSLIEEPCRENQRIYVCQIY